MDVESQLRAAAGIVAGMKQRHKGTIIKPGSIAGLLAIAMRNLDAASKWAVVALSRSLTA